MKNIIIIGILLLANVGWAYTPMTSLTLIHPSASQPARIGVAYPGIEYNVRVAAIGGKFPYTYALSNAPMGMTIDAQTGTITWTNPQSTASNIQVTVTDSLSTSVNYTWSITVGTSGFKFVDVANGNDDTGDGTLATPWKTFSKAIATAASSDILYFRAGTYTPTWVNDNWLSSSRAGTWLGYPGETVTFDFSLNSGYRLGITRQIYFDNLTFYHGSQWMLYISSGVNRQVIRRCTFNDLNLTSGSNPAFIRYEAAGTGSYSVLQDNVFHDTENTLKGSFSMYSEDYPLIEDNYIYDSGHTQMDLKEGIRYFTVRRNHFDNYNFSKTGAAAPGELSDNQGLANRCNGEFVMNFFRANDANNTSGSAGNLYICNDNAIRGFDSLVFYRNTIYGTPYMSYCDNTVGPISFENNVIVNDSTNSDGDATDKIYNRQAANFTNWSKTDNLLLATSVSGINTTTGALQGDYTSYVGTRGWELGEADTTAPTVTISTSDPSAISADSLSISGTASDAVGVSLCKYRIGAAPDATHGTSLTGTTSWSGTATGFSDGANTLYVGCADAAGNYGTDSITVNYTAPATGHIGGSGVFSFGGGE